MWRSGIGYTSAIIHRAANLYLNAIGGGGQSTQGIQAIGVLDVNSHFKFIRLVDGSYALQTPNGVTSVTADDGGGIASGNNLLTNQTHIQAWETFKIVDQGNGTYAIQTISGFFLGIGPGGVISTRISDPNAAPQIGYTAKFELVMVGLVKQSP